jgi:hypothetical protein
MKVKKLLAIACALLALPGWRYGNPNTGTQALHVQPMSDGPGINTHLHFGDSATNIAH